VSPRALLAGSVHEVARALVGCTLLKNGVGGVIVETEAYAPDDPASHSFRGRSPRNGAMFGQPGTLYVYRSYGVHWCVNVACEPEGTGAAVLLRALEPLYGIGEMRARRGREDPQLLCSGPGRLTQALGIDGGDDGASVERAPFSLRAPRGGLRALDVVTTPRIGVTRAAERPWRYVVRDSSWASRGRRRASP
jgi:DNA-3-methyladenine glycosylase